MYKLLCLFVFLTVCAVESYEYECTYTSKNYFYDLSPLSNCNGTGYTVKSSDGTFTINICNNLAACNSAGVCQYNTACGYPSQANFIETDPGKGLNLTYKGGDICFNGVHRQSILNFICDPSATKPKFLFISENPICTYNFQIITKDACPKPVAPQKELCIINAYVVPHTHDDVGWLLTIEEYYKSSVKAILDTTVAALTENPNRTFIYAEQAFFTLWWYDPNTSDDQRTSLKQLVKEGRWEFVIGAWVMPDEACTTYGGIIDQMTLGHQFLLNTFGVAPTKGWQIDPFGASCVTPVLEKLAGFDAHVIDRVLNKDTNQNSRRLQFLWEGSYSIGKKGEIFSEILGGGDYCDWVGGVLNYSTDPVNSSNVASYGQLFVDMVYSRANWYRTPNMLVEWGCDFTFMNAKAEFHSLDQIIEWLQANVEKTHIKVRYGVLSDYFESVWADSQNLGTNWPNVDQGDFLPYIWTGFFSAREELKGWVRVGEAVAHLVEPLFSLGRLTLQFDIEKTYNQLYQLRIANSQVQHHDGVTGTSVPYVVLMYQNAIIDGKQQALDASSTILNSWVQKPQGPLADLVAGTDALLNMKCGQTVAVVVFNSLGWTKKEVVVLPVNLSNLIVLASNQNKISSQISIAVGGNVTSKFHLFFVATVGPLGYETYFIQCSSLDITSKPIIKNITNSFVDLNFENSIISVTISQATGRISSITNKKNNVTLPVDQNLMEYVSLNASSAYTFVPEGPAFPLSNIVPQTTISVGPVVTEIHQIFLPSNSSKSYGKQTIRLYHASGDEDVENFVEILYNIGPLPSHRDIVTTFTTTINTAGVITTDDNGFEFLKRQYQWGIGIENNYYPLIYASYINDNIAQLTIISSRSHGVSSQIDGEIEVMIHRNPNCNGDLGLTDTTEVFPVLRVIVDIPQKSIPKTRTQSYYMNFPLSVFSAVTKSALNWTNSYLTSNNFLVDLPANIHLLSLNAIDSNSKTAILRLTHLYAVGDDPFLSQPVSINFSKLFVGVIVATVTETTLTANKVLGMNTIPVVEVKPKEIRTFLVTFT